MSETHIAPGLFRTRPRLCLIGGRHRQTRKLVFPLPADDGYEPVELPDRGTLWSFTVQRFAPKSPPYRGGEPFMPFAVGYVELPGALIVEGRLVDADFDALRIGMPMELTTLELGPAASGPAASGPAAGAGGRGGAVQSYAFRPSTAP